MAAPNPVDGKPNGVFIPGEAQHWAYATLGLGSALALFMYPHSITASLSAATRNTIRRNAAILPAYSFVLGLLALLGWVAIAAGTKPIGARRQAQRPARHPAAVRGLVPVVVRGRGLRGDRDRGARAGGHHVDRGGQHLHPQHLQGVDQARRDAAAGGQGLQARLARRQGVRAGLRARCSTSRTRSTSSCSAASGSSRPSRPSCSASTPGGCTGGRCSPAGRSAWSTARGRPGTSPTRAAGVNHFGGSLAQMPVIGELGYIALTAFVINLVVAVVLTLVLRATKAPERRRRDDPRRLLRRRGRPGCGRCRSRSTRRPPARDAPGRAGVTAACGTPARPRRGPGR